MAHAQGLFQCPQCGTLWNPGANELQQRIHILATKHAKLLKQRDLLAQTVESEHSYEYRLKNNKLKTEILTTEHVLKCLRGELRGKPSQIWQARYQNAAELAQKYMSPEKYKRYKEELDEACRPKEIRQ